MFKFWRSSVGMRIYVDGGVRKQHLGRQRREEGAIAIVLESKKIVENVGMVTNNEAEYLALIRALEIAISKGIENIEILSDSELVVRQVEGEYKVRKKELMPLYEKVMKLSTKFKSFKIEHISREENPAGKLLE
ncbi:MAG: ribonuclease HI family protein [Candidatus Hydrothermarchaeaceae archaeon]